MAAALAGVLGLVLGSFIAGLTWRWPRGVSSLSGRSRCATCSGKLGVRDLVPVFSWLVQRGRCRQCGAAVPVRHLAIEVAAAIICVVSMLVAPGPAGLIFGVGLLVLLVLDTEHFWLPDAVVLPLAGLGLWLGMGDITARTIGAVAGFAALWLIATAYRRLAGRDGMGAGDPKLLGAIGAWLGWAALPLVLLAASLLGLALVALDRLRGRAVARNTMLPLGALMAAAAWPMWLLLAAGALDTILP